MSHQWLGMNFTPKEWHQLMNIFLKGFGDYVNKLSQEAIKKMKENQRREQGND
ncbi:MAG: hypothetical protein ACD_17C00473G0001 [uncultured bacterium]|nr:MAG: hypothetical protein ACD_17C00473G0001 [uncultured bacterium]